MLTLQRLQALLTKANTYLVAVPPIIAYVAQQLHDQFPGDTAVQHLVAGLITAGAAVTSIVAVVRRSIEVIPEQRQILPLPAGTQVVASSGEIVAPDVPAVQMMPQFVNLPIQTGGGAGGGGAVGGRGPIYGGAAPPADPGGQGFPRTPAG